MNYKSFYFFLILIVIIFPFLSCVSSDVKEEEPYQYSNVAARIYTKLPKNTERMHFYEYGNGFLIFDIRRPKLFMLQDEKEIPTAYCSITYRAYGAYTDNRPEPNINKIRIDGILTNFSRENLPPKEIDKRIVRKLKMIVGENEYIFDFNVEVIPISLGITYDELINILGQPDDEMKGANDTWSINPSDPTYYNPNLNNRYHSYWTLRYNKYSGYTFMFDDDGILRSFS